MAEGISPTAFAAQMNRFYRVATRVLLDHGAIIDKMVGDEVMALFVPGLAGRDYRVAAVRAGEALLHELRKEPQQNPLAVGIAVHAGPAFVGNVGSQGISDFTALGDTVNSAARLQAVAAPGELIISETAYGAVQARYPELEQRLVTLRGRSEPLTARTLRVSG